MHRIVLITLLAAFVSPAFAANTHTHTGGGFAAFFQSGDGNSATVTQNCTSCSAVTVQSGNNNTSTITQKQTTAILSGGQKAFNFSLGGSGNTQGVTQTQ